MNGTAPKACTRFNYYPFGMLMPGRKYSAGTGYRYGFNGKEDDDDVKGEGNQQDYGMRIYDTRLGRFLSVDPLAVKYPFYTPYAFAGNDVLRCVDLDGTEPASKTEKWKESKFKSKATTIDVYDKLHEQVFSAHLINDPNTGKSWIVADDGQGKNKYFYLRNDNKSTNSIEYYSENGRLQVVNGHFEHFETQNQKEARFDNQIADGFGYMAVGIVAAPLALEGAIAAGSSRLLNTGIDYTSQVAGNYLSGKRGSEAWAKNINLTSLGVSFFNPGSSWGKLAANNTISSLASYTPGEGYNGIGAGKSLDVALTQAIVGTLAGRFTRGTDLRNNQLLGRLNHLNLTLGAENPLSTSLQSAIRNTSIVGGTIGVISGSTGNAINNKVEKKE